MTILRFGKAAAAFACVLAMAGAFASDTICSAQSGALVAPVLELYTSEGCSSCPPADRWLSGLKSQFPANGALVVQAFHVAYWDNLGWVDRFANPAHAERQRQLARWNHQVAIYTPQVVRDGRNWPRWSDAGASVAGQRQPALVSVQMQALSDGRIEALVAVQAKAVQPWSAYWTVTEDGHASRVKAGENAGEYLRHDFVVRQYTPVGGYDGIPGQAQKLVLRPVAATPGHARRVNLVVYDARTGATLQALSIGC